MMKDGDGSHCVKFCIVGKKLGRLFFIIDIAISTTYMNVVSRQYMAQEKR